MPAYAGMTRLAVAEGQLWAPNIRKALGRRQDLARRSTLLIATRMDPFPGKRRSMDVAAQPLAREDREQLLEHLFRRALGAALGEVDNS